MSEKEKDKRQDLYAETRKDLLTRQLSNSEKFDGAILTLSTGALAISLAFIKDIVPFDNIQEIGWLIISWWLFGTAIVSTLASFWTSQFGIKRQLQYAEEYYLRKKEEFLTKRNLPARATDFLNFSSGILFILALIFTIMFVSVNLRGGPNMAKNEGNKIPLGAPIPEIQKLEGSGDIKRGATIPNMQPVPNTQSQATGGQSGSTKPQSSGEQSGNSQKGQSNTNNKHQ